MTDRKIRKVSEWVIGLAFVLAGVWDIIAVLWCGSGCTESVSMRDWGWDPRKIFFIVTLGILIGHFFFNVPYDPPFWVSLGIMPVLLGLLYYFGQKGQLPVIHPAVTFQTGFFASALLWPQAPKE